MKNRIVTWRNPETEVRVKLLEWIYQEPIREQFVEPPQNIWLLWNYLRKIGLISVITKIRSRLSEKDRNQKICGLGIGKVVDAPEPEIQILHRDVLFFASNHSAKSKTLVVNKLFIMVLSETIHKKQHSEPICELPLILQEYRAWSPYSGREVNPSKIHQALSSIATNIVLPKNVNVNLDETISEYREGKGSANLNISTPSAVLFGLGNYAKTAIIPNIKQSISLQRVHEIDPDQLVFLNSNSTISLDTSPVPRDDRKFDVWFIAGFHHTHTDLAIKAIEQGSYAVIEKPLATTQKQYQSFTRALEKHSEYRFFLCFHKRYSKLHDYFLKDIGCDLGSPVDMHCIIYEIPLPIYHWYNWPSSGSRLISNGCHWIDYFMFVNNYASIMEYRKWKPRGSDVIVQVQLENGAYFSMTLTDVGSQRLGVRDYIDLRHGEVTITMIDSSTYIAENRNHVFNRKKVNPLNAYARMYHRISLAIANGSRGDDFKSLKSSELTLLLEDAD